MLIYISWVTNEVSQGIVTAQQADKWSWCTATFQENVVMMCKREITTPTDYVLYR